MHHRIIVFDVAGVIRIGNKIQAASDITIAGQTAPGDGVMIYGNRFHLHPIPFVHATCGSGEALKSKGACTLVADDLQNAIFDHVSIN